MKKLVKFMTASLLLLGLAACGGSDDPKGGTPSDGIPSGGTPSEGGEGGDGGDGGGTTGGDEEEFDSDNYRLLVTIYQNYYDTKEVPPFDEEGTGEGWYIDFDDAGNWYWSYDFETDYTTDSDENLRSAVEDMIAAYPDTIHPDPDPEYGTLVVETDEDTGTKYGYICYEVSAEDYVYAEVYAYIPEGGSKVVNFFCIGFSEADYDLFEGGEDLPDLPEGIVYVTVDDTGASGTTYTDWTFADGNTSFKGNSAGGNESIQIRSKNNNSGIVMTASEGNVATVYVQWNSNTDATRVLNVYGSNTPFASPADLYAEGANKIGTIANGTSEFTVTGDYQYVGIRSNSGAIYLDVFGVVYAE